MKKLYEYRDDCGRMGYIEGRFVCDESELSRILNREIYLGEVLGKHSEIIIKITEENLKVVTDNQEFLKMAQSLNVNLDSGYNPFDYLEDEDDDQDDEE